MDYIVFLDGNLLEVSASTRTRVTDDEAVTFYELFYILQISQGNYNLFEILFHFIGTFIL